MTSARTKPDTPAAVVRGGVFSFLRRRREPLILFDFDGVVVDSFDVHFSVFSEICAEMGFHKLNSPEAFLRLFDGNAIFQLIRSGFPVHRLRALAEQFRPRIEAACARIQPFPGMPEVLSELARRHPVHMVTSNNTAHVEDFAARHGITGLRSVVGADVEISKIKKIRRIKRLEPGHRAWYVGDTLGDMRETRRAFARPVAVAWGWHDLPRLRRGRPWAVVHTPEELLTLPWGE